MNKILFVFFLTLITISCSKKEEVKFEAFSPEAFAYDMEWIRVKFQQVEFVATEGQGSIKIFVERDQLWSNGRYSLAYSTSDLTAVGVDTAKFA